MACPRQPGASEHPRVRPPEGETTRLGRGGLTQNWLHARSRRPDVDSGLALSASTTTVSDDWDRTQMLVGPLTAFAQVFDPMTVVGCRFGLVRSVETVSLARTAATTTSDVPDP